MVKDISLGKIVKPWFKFYLGLDYCGDMCLHMDDLHVPR